MAVQPIQQKTSFPCVLNLNVGGQIYTTSLSTLTKYSDSMLGAMFSGRFPVQQDSNGNYFIDRDGALFRFVLEFLRNGELEAPENPRESLLLLKEAEYFQIPVLIETVKEQMKNLEKRKGRAQEETRENLTIISKYTYVLVQREYLVSVSGRLRTLKEMLHICDGKDGRFQIFPYDDQKDGSEYNKTGVMKPTTDTDLYWFMEVANAHGFKIAKQIKSRCYYVLIRDSALGC